MSTEKYAQFISRQQRQLSVSGTNTPVGTLDEALGSMANIKAASKKGYEDSRKGQPPLSDKQKKIAAQAGDLEKIEGEDFAKLRAMKKEEIEQVDEVIDTPMKKIGYLSAAVASAKKAQQAGDTLTPQKRLRGVNLVNKKHLPADLPEEAEIEEAKERSDRYLGTVHKDDPDYDKKVSELKGKATGGARVRGRLGKDNPNRGLYGKGGPLKSAHAQDIKPEHGSRVDVYSKKAMKKEEISLEESAYLEEMIGKGKLPDVLQYHKNNMEHHRKMADHHDDMATRSDKIGDSEGWDYHISRGMSHDMDAQHHEARYNHAAGLAAKAKAHKEIKNAEATIAKARQAKKDY